LKFGPGGRKGEGVEELGLLEVEEWDVEGVREDEIVQGGLEARGEPGMEREERDAVWTRRELEVERRWEGVNEGEEGGVLSDTGR